MCPKLDSYQDEQIQKQWVEEAAQMDAYRKQNNLTIEDTSESAGFLDRAPVSYDLLKYTTRDPYEKMLTERIEESKKAFNASKVDQTPVWEVDPSNFGPTNQQIIERWRAKDSEIDNLRLLDYQGSMKDVKKVNEIEHEMIDEYSKIAAKDQVQTVNSTIAGKIGFATGAFGLFMNPVESPVNAVTSLVGGGIGGSVLRNAWMAGGAARITQGALRMAAIDQTVTAFQFSRDEPINKKMTIATGGEYTNEDMAKNYAFASLLTLAGSAVGGAIDIPAAVKYRMGAGSRYVQKEVPTATIKTNEIKGESNGPSADIRESDIQPSQQPLKEPISEGETITPSFVNRFENARAKMDPAEAEVIDSIIDIARTTPEHLNQSQHASNYEAVARSYATGEDIEIPYTERPVETESKALMQNNREVPQEASITQEPITIEQRIEEQTSTLEARLNEVPDDVELRSYTADDLPEESKTVGGVKAKLKAMREENDVFDKVITCWSNGGPAANVKPK